MKYFRAKSYKYNHFSVIIIKCISFRLGPMPEYGVSESQAVWGYVYLNINFYNYEY